MSFQKYSKRANLIVAKSAMLENANYLENFYSKCYRYNERDALGEDCTWPILPKAKVAHFDIAFSTTVPGCQTESYIMYAIADSLYRKEENCYLRMDEDKNIVLCVSQGQDNRDVDQCDVFE